MSKAASNDRPQSKHLKPWQPGQSGNPTGKRKTPDGVRRALQRMLSEPPERPHFPLQPPVLHPAVVGLVEGKKPMPAVAMDSAAYDYARLAMDSPASLYSSGLYTYGDIGGFPGYPYLNMLALRVEYRNMASALSTEIARKWIKFQSSEGTGDSTKTKITELEQRFKDLGVQQIFRYAAERDALDGAAPILVNIRGADQTTPLIISPKTIKKGSLIGFKNVEMVWVTPLMFNANDPTRDDFYVPSSWWVMGQRWHSSRIMMVLTRPVPDILKPAFNFGGISLSQLVEPYVNNWLRARQSVSDLINNFSIVVLKTAMDQVLAGGDDGTNLFARLKLFTLTRSNKGLMALDKDREELEQIAVPLGGLHELQSQAQEQMYSAAREPVVMATGIAPAGLNTSSDGEIRLWYDWIHAQQEGHYRNHIEKCSQIVQLDMYGEIDPDITFEFVPLLEMSEKEESEIRMNDSVRAGNLIDRGVIDAQEERERIARDPDSLYNGIDLGKEIAPPMEQELEAPLRRGVDSAIGYDAEFVESEHPRDEDGKFTEAAESYQEFAASKGFSKENLSHSYNEQNWNEFRSRYPQHAELKTRQIRRYLDVKETPEQRETRRAQNAAEEERRDRAETQWESEQRSFLNYPSRSREADRKKVLSYLDKKGIKYSSENSSVRYKSGYIHLQDNYGHPLLTIRIADHPQKREYERSSGTMVPRGGYDPQTGDYHEVAEFSIDPSNRDVLQTVKAAVERLQQEKETETA